MPISDVLHLEGWSFLCLLGGIVTYRLLTRGIDLGGIFAGKDGSRGSSPERVQLLIATLAMSATYLAKVAQSTDGRMPEVSRDWLVLFGGSSGVYVSVKGLKALIKR